jgi:microcystin-dependent protein
MSETFIGQIMLGGFNFAPKNFSFCDGSTLSISQNQALYSLLGTQFGGNGTSTFALPDLRGRVPVGFGHDYAMGQRGGEENVTLQPANLPSHSHALQGTTSAATQRAPTGGVLAQASEALYATPGSEATLAAQTVAHSGGSMPHTNLQPFQALNYAICLAGIFPSRS